MKVSTWILACACCLMCLAPTTRRALLEQRRTVEASSGTAMPTEGLSLWLDAQDLAYADGVKASNWVDKSGSGHDFTSPDTSSPFVTNNVVNGLRALRFTGASTSVLTNR